MIQILHDLKSATARLLLHSYNIDIPLNDINIERTNPDHTGNLTLLIFPLAKRVKKNPEELCQQIGDYLLNHTQWIKQFDIIKGFLNLSLSPAAWAHTIKNFTFSYTTDTPQRIVVEYCGPNTNKPLHIGHLRNIFLGQSIVNILKSIGHHIITVNINNDRGIAICKSMTAYQLFGNNQTPQSLNVKPDHFVGDFYVKYSQELKSQVDQLIAQGLNPKEAEKKAPITLANEDMLRKWEEGDAEVRNLWTTMNNWFYTGSRITLDILKVNFDKEYYESNEYQKGKEIVEQGLAKGVFYRDDSGAIVIDLTDRGLDIKVLQRADGTSIYITQDLALIHQRYLDFNFDRIIYVVADEQNYHFKVLSEVCQALDMDFSKSIHHLSYGMVVSKDGSKFKSREGTAADADDIIQDVILEAKNQSLESGRANHLSPNELDQLSHILGLGALRFAMLKVGPQKNIPFDSKENVDIHGDTAPYIQYSYVRTQSILLKANIKPQAQFNITEVPQLSKAEQSLIVHLAYYPSAIASAAQLLDPSVLAIYLLQLAKLFNRFYHDSQILNAIGIDRDLRLQITLASNIALKNGLELLAIDVPDRM